MNCSGDALKEIITDKIINNFLIDNLIVIHDDLDLPLGKVKLKFKSGSGGHRGVRSLINFLEDNKFFRIKIGIGKPDNKQVINYVLEKFNNREMEKIEKAIYKAANSTIFLGMYKNISKVSNIV